MRIESCNVLGLAVVLAPTVRCAALGVSFSSSAELSELLISSSMKSWPPSSSSFALLIEYFLAF